MIIARRSALALIALAALATAAPSAHAGIIVQNGAGSPVGDVYTYDVVITVTGLEVTIEVGDTITLFGISPTFQAGLTLPAPSSGVPQFTPTFTSGNLVLTATTEVVYGLDSKFSFTLSAPGSAPLTNQTYSLTYLDERDGPLTVTESTLTIPTVSVAASAPEPSTIALAAVGLAGAAFARRRKA